MLSEGTKTMICISMVLMIVITLFMGFTMLSEYYMYKSQVKECNDYNDYGYYTEMKGKWCFFCLDNSYDCLIHMEDGTKLPLKDFRTISIKNALVRG